MKHDLLIEISPDGEIKITVRGIKGTACQGKALNLGRLLGEVEEYGHTEEWHETPLVRPATQVKRD